MAQAHAFISYVRDNQDIVDRLANDLRNFGVKIWLDRNDIMLGQWWKDAINEAIQNGAFFIACFSKELNDRQETYMHGELRLAIDRLRNMPKNRIWFIPVLINETKIPSHAISDHESLSDINAVMLFKNWDDGLANILRSIRLDDPKHRRALPLIDLIRYHATERSHALQHLVCTTDVIHLAVPALAEALRDGDGGSRVRGRAAEALANIGPAAEEAVPALAGALRDDGDGEVRGRAAFALVKIGPAAVPALTEILRDDDGRVRRRAAFALGKIGPAAVPGLIEALRDDDGDVRRRVAEALSAAGIDIQLS